jgi:hypothetical protein
LAICRDELTKCLAPRIPSEPRGGGWFSKAQIPEFNGRSDVPVPNMAEWR